LFPSLNTSADAAFSGEIENEVKETAGLAGMGDEGTTKRFSAGFDAGWELDLFGGVRRSLEAADADLDASREDLRDAWVSLAAEVAVTYLEVRTSQARLAVAQANLEAQRETLDMTSARHDAGLENELAVHQARYSVESTQSRIPALRAGLEAALFGLAVLQGKTPGAVHPMPGPSGSIPVPPGEIAVGIPADVLRQRPDIRRAERELAARTARIGEATADLYPRIRLSGSIGVETLDLNHLGKTAVWPFGYGLSIQWPVFDAGRIRRNIDAQKALQEQALARFQGAVLSALKEVETAMSAYALERKRLEALGRAAGAAEEAVELARIRYEAGLIDFGDVLEAQRSLLGFQDQVAESEGSVAADLVRLYKALGGGWQAMTWVADTEEEEPSMEERSR
jgi:NodT family efflux transporter outer membrane factor (OMF) lipoprotein